MQKSKKIGFITCIFIIFLIIISLIYIVSSKENNLTLSMYKKINNSEKYTLTMEGEDNEYSYKISIARNGTDLSIDTNTKFEEEEQHTTILVTDDNTYYISHTEEEYSVLDSGDIETDNLIPELNDVSEKTYVKGKEKIMGKTYYYEEYENISTYLMLIDAEEEGSLKTRFYYKDGNLEYIKNIIEQDGDTVEELVKINCVYDVEDSLFEIPESYAEI